MYAPPGPSPAPRRSIRPDIARESDTRGHHCPGPLSEAIRLVRECSVGETIAVLADDPSAGSSIPAWVQKAGHSLTVEESPMGCRYLLTRNR